MSQIDRIERFQDGEIWRGEQDSPHGLKRLDQPSAKKNKSIFQTWRERSQSRAALRNLDEQQLRDVGLSRREAEREARKPFWRK